MNDGRPDVLSAFDNEPDWQFPLRIGVPPGIDGHRIGRAAVPGLVGAGLTWVLLGVDGLECDIALARTPADLRMLADAATFRANLVLALDYSDDGWADEQLLTAAAGGVGAIGYALARFGDDRLPVLVEELEAGGATVEAALTSCGPHTLIGHREALAVSPLAAVVASTEHPAITGITRSTTIGAGNPLIFEGIDFEGIDGISESPGMAGPGEFVRPRPVPTGTHRFLQAALHHREAGDRAGARVRFGILRNRPMLLLVGIGPLGPARLVADIALDESLLGQPGPDGWDLDITLKPETGDILRHSLRLPPTGPSTDVAFPLDVTAGSERWEGRITVWHNARAIQSAVLSAPVLDADTDPGDGQRPRLVIDGEFHPMAGLDAHTAGGVTVELDARPAVYSSTGDFLVEPRDAEMRSANNRIAARLGEMAVELDEAADLADPRARALLVYLAVQGSLLWEALFPDPVQREAVRGERFLQALQLSDAAPELPYEFIYDLPSPPPDFTLCTEWTDGISAGSCPRCHTAGADNQDILCPLGFWGLRKVIERHNAIGAGESRAQARLRRGDIAGRAPVRLKRAVLALSERADRPPRGAAEDYVAPSQRIVQSLGQAGLSFDGPIADWRDWERVIVDRQPDLLIVLAHNRFDDDRGEWSMQIGSASDLYVTRVFPEYVDSPAETPGPVVFLFGCLTASEGAEQATFARQFRQRNASVVIGTTSTVLGRQAGPVAAALVEAVKATAGSLPLGELLRRARADGLAKGSVMALALNAFGDADYRLCI